MIGFLHCGQALRRPASSSSTFKGVPQLAQAKVVMRNLLSAKELRKYRGKPSSNPL
jgi:hypothetical protein